MKYQSAYKRKLHNIKYTYAKVIKVIPVNSLATLTTPVALTARIKIKLSTQGVFLSQDMFLVTFRSVFTIFSCLLFLQIVCKYRTLAFFRGLTACAIFLGLSENLARNIHLHTDETCCHTDQDASSSAGQKRPHFF